MGLQNHLYSLYAVNLGVRQEFIASQTISITKWYLLTLTWGFKKCLERARDVNYDPVLGDNETKQASLP